MRKLLHVLLFIALLVPSFTTFAVVNSGAVAKARSVVAGSNIDTSKWRTYRSSHFGVEFKYPSDIFVVQGDKPDSNDLSLIDKKYVGKSVEIHKIPNLFGIGFSVDTSVESQLAEESAFQDSKDNVNFAKAEDGQVGGQNAVKITSVNKTTKKVLGSVTYFELPYPITVPYSTDIASRPGEPKSITYNLASVNGWAKKPGVIDEIIKSIKFFDTHTTSKTFGDVSACLPADIKMSDVVSAEPVEYIKGMSSIVKTTVAQMMFVDGATCNPSGKPFDQYGRPIVFYHMQGCWGTPPPNSDYILQKQDAEIQSMMNSSDVIQMSCNPSGIPIP